MPGHPPEVNVCLERLEYKVAQTRGVERAHLEKQNGKAERCIHYDPDLLGLVGLERAATEAGAEVQLHYRHETMRLGGLHCTDCAGSADIVLMADDLSKVPYAISLSRASRRMIVQNLAISLGVIALLVPSALLGRASISIAIVVHEGSTLVVVFNALRLLAFRDKQRRSA